MGLKSISKRSRNERSEIDAGEDLKRHTVKSDKKTAYGADDRAYNVDEMICANCKHPYQPLKYKSMCFDCAQNPQQLLHKKHTATRFEKHEYESCTHTETVEQAPSIDGEVLVRCKKCGIIVKSYYLGKRRT